MDLFFFYNNPNFFGSLSINFKNVKKLVVGVVSLTNHMNIGNVLVKYSMYIQLKEFGFDPIIIGYTKNNENIDFLRKNLKLKEVNQTFSELKKEDYDILMVNSDQTWNDFIPDYFLDYGFLNFSEKWNIPKFVYGASLGYGFWKYSKELDLKMKYLIKNFTGISVRESSAVNLVKEHLGIEPELVLDPTLLINKEYYINIIKNFKSDFDLNKKYICVYQLDGNDFIKEYIEEVKNKLKLPIYRVELINNYVENFISLIYMSQAVITDSYHGTIFSIIFNKPFISFINSNRGSTRFISLNETFDLADRISFPNNKTKSNIDILIKPLNINQTKFNIIRISSLKYLKKNLNIS